MCNSPRTETTLYGPDRVVGTREAARLLAVSDSTLEKWCAAGAEAGLMPLPVYRVGRQWRWRTSELASWLESRRADA